MNGNLEEAEYEGGPAPKGETLPRGTFKPRSGWESNQTSVLTVCALAWKKIAGSLERGAYGCGRLLGILPSFFLPSFIHGFNFNPFMLIGVSHVLGTRHTAELQHPQLSSGGVQILSGRQPIVNKEI